MKATTFCTFILILMCSPSFLYSQAESSYPYEPSVEHPFGLPNPEAPEQIKDFAPIIGECTCESVARGADQSWQPPVSMIWRFKYIMNGQAVQDESLKEDGTYSGSIRQYNADSAKWYVHYYATNGVPSTLPAWEGGKKEDGNIVLYRDSPSPTGAPGDYRITFFNISQEGFDWIGEWVDKAESIQYPLWKISCKKKEGS
ncbi:MAG: hypothetical protein AAF824_22765 [Bacteroidota bacterium]